MAFVPDSPNHASDGRKHRIYAGNRFARLNGRVWEPVENAATISADERTGEFQVDVLGERITFSPVKALRAATVIEPGPIREVVRAAAVALPGAIRDPDLQPAAKMRKAVTRGTHFGHEVEVDELPDAIDYRVTYTSGVQKLANGDLFVREIDGARFGCFFDDLRAVGEVAQRPGNVLRVDLRAARADAVAEGRDTIDLDPTTVYVTADATGFGSVKNEDSTFAITRNAVDPGDYEFDGVNVQTRVRDKTTSWNFKRALLRFDRTLVPGQASLAEFGIVEESGRAEDVRIARCAFYNPFNPALGEPSEDQRLNYGRCKTGGYGGASLGYEAGVTNLAFTFEVDAYDGYTSNVTDFYNAETGDWLDLGLAEKNDVENTWDQAPGTNINTIFFSPGSGGDYEPRLEVTEAAAGAAWFFQNQIIKPAMD